jgi:hypothetical protein
MKKTALLLLAVLVSAPVVAQTVPRAPRAT